jgi:hypothetical protein
MAQINDWVSILVKGKGRLFGWIIDDSANLLTIYIPSQHAVTTIWDYECSRENPYLTKEEASAMAEFALMTNDREWFMELTQR